MIPRRPTDPSSPSWIRLMRDAMQVFLFETLPRGTRGVTEACFQVSFDTY